MSNPVEPLSILITGANRGIGFGLTSLLCARGHRVFATARNLDRARALRELGSEFPNLVMVALDVTSDISTESAFTEIKRHTPLLDVLVNNAAIFPGEGKESLSKLDLKWFAEAVETNVTGVARVTRMFLPLLRRAPRGRVVNISSGAGSISAKEDSNYYPYAVSKAGLNMLTRAMAAELLPEGIIVTAVAPGWVRTDMGGPNAPLSVEESTGALAATIENLRPSDSGKFLGRDGKTNDYTW
jgi:NAD(P)-dependent dehydrogenase (short-subunit alcohol dehydrogenase family)